MERLFSLHTGIFQLSITPKVRWLETAAANDLHSAAEKIETKEQLRALDGKNETTISKDDVEAAEKKIQEPITKHSLTDDPEVKPLFNKIKEELSKIKGTADITTEYSATIKALREIKAKEAEKPIAQPEQEIKLTGNPAVDKALGTVKTGTEGMATEMKGDSIWSMISKIGQFFKLLTSGDFSGIEKWLKDWGEKPTNTDGREMFKSVAECKKSGDFVALLEQSEANTERINAKLSEKLPDEARRTLEAQKNHFIGLGQEAGYQLHRRGFNQEKDISSAKIFEIGDGKTLTEAMNAQNPQQEVKKISASVDLDARSGKRFAAISSDGTILEISSDPKIAKDKKYPSLWVKSVATPEKQDTTEERLGELKNQLKPSDLLLYSTKATVQKESKGVQNPFGNKSIDLKGLSSGGKIENLLGKEGTKSFASAAVLDNQTVKTAKQSQISVDTLMKEQSSGQYLIVREVDSKSTVVAFGTVKPFEAEKK